MTHPAKSRVAPGTSTAPAAASPASAAFPCIAAAWHAHEAELRAWLARHLHVAEAADDLLQDIFIKAIGRGAGFCDVENPRAWLFQVTRTTLIDSLRTRHPTDPFVDDGDEYAAPEITPPEPVDALAACLARTLAELSAPDAAVLRACDLEGQTQREFAAANGLTLAATKARLLRARLRFRERLTTACRVRFDPDNGRVCGHDGRTVSPRRIG